MQVTYSNVISPLADLEAEQFPLVQSCVFPKLISTSDDVRIASAEAERRIDAHVQMCRYHSLLSFHERLHSLAFVDYAAGAGHP